MATILIALVVGIVSVVVSKANCSACIGQFCGSTMECPHGCFCAKEMGQPTGRCLGD